MRYQRISPDTLALTNGRRANSNPNLKAYKENEEEEDKVEDRILESKGVSRFRSPSKTQKQEHQHLKESNGGGGVNGDVLLQWGHKKRSRCSRGVVASTTTTDDSSSSSSMQQPIKLQRRSSAPQASSMPPPSSLPHHPPFSNGVGKASKFTKPCTGNGSSSSSAAASPVRRSIEERSGGGGGNKSSPPPIPSVPPPSGGGGGGVSSSSRSRVGKRSSAGASVVDKKAAINTPPSSSSPPAEVAITTTKKDQKINGGGGYNSKLSQQHNYNHIGEEGTVVDDAKAVSPTVNEDDDAINIAATRIKEKEKEKEKVVSKIEWPRIYIGLSRKEKEEDYIRMKGGNKLPHRPKKRPKAVDRLLQYCYPGMWLSDLTRARYEVREKKCSTNTTTSTTINKKQQKRRGLKGMESTMVESDSE